MIAALCATPSVASADSLLGVMGGLFVPRGEGGRARSDVLVENLYVPDPFVYDISDFNGGQIGGEYLLGLGEFVEVGVGAMFYQRTVPSFYGESTHQDGSDITQDIKMRIVPVTASVRFFPIGRTVPVQPYVGGGVNFYRWKYSESGEFVDYDDPRRPIFVDTFEDDGTATGGMFLAGVRAPIAGDRFLVGGEFRYQGGTADLDRSLFFTGDKLDLSGFSLVGTFHVRF